MRAKAIVGSGYGDESKGLMTDYFCHKLSSDKEHVLNIRTNGGTQAGHTVCRFDEENLRYNMWVFRNMGSGSLVFADTFLASRFIVNCYELSDELSKFKKHFGYSPIVFISGMCRLQFRADEAINRAIEYARTYKHGTCGFGIFETVNRHHMSYELRMAEAYDYYCTGRQEELVDKIMELSASYTQDRIKYINDTEKLGIDVSNIVSNLREYAFKTVEDLWRLFDDHKHYVKLAELDNLMKCGEYSQLVFECSQGLELNWGDERNTPHVTASHTGVTNIIKELKTCSSVDMITDFEVCYVTRSYKTKHGSGEFKERDYDIKDEYNLYDRTNAPNRFQGTLEYGLLDKERMVKLINEDFSKLVESNVLCDICKVSKSLAVTHLDQTNEAVLTTRGKEFFKEFNAKYIIGGDMTYYSFGEKATDVVEYKV